MFLHRFPYGLLFWLVAAYKVSYLRLDLSCCVVGIIVEQPLALTHRRGYGMAIGAPAWSWSRQRFWVRALVHDVHTEVVLCGVPGLCPFSL